MCLFQVIPGATSKTLVLPRSGGNGLTKEDSGRYQCMVTYQDLKEITNNATLDVFSEYLFAIRICNLLMNCCNTRFFFYKKVVYKKVVLEWLKP